MTTRQAGFFFSLAVLNCIKVNLPFPVALLLKIAHGGATRSLETLKQVRLNLAKSLEGIRDNPSQLDEDVMSFQMTFTVQEGGEELPLIPGHHSHRR